MKILLCGMIRARARELGQTYWIVCNQYATEVKSRRSAESTYHASRQVGQSLLSGAEVLLGRSCSASSPTKGWRASRGGGRHLD